MYGKDAVTWPLTRTSGEWPYFIWQMFLKQKPTHWHVWSDRTTSNQIYHWTFFHVYDTFNNYTMYKYQCRTKYNIQYNQVLVIFSQQLIYILYTIPFLFFIFFPKRSLLKIQLYGEHYKWLKTTNYFWSCKCCNILFLFFLIYLFIFIFLKHSLYR